MSLDPDISVSVIAAPRINAVVKPAQHISVEVSPAEIHIVGTAALGPRGPAGPPGDPGPTGDQGPPGDTGNDGRTPDFAGDWFDTVEYWPSAIVRYGNATYGSRGYPPIGTAPTTGDVDDPWWQLVAEDGTGGGGASVINMPADWDYGPWAGMIGDNGILVDADHPYEVRIIVRISVPDLSGANAEVWLLVAADSDRNWISADASRFQRQGSAGSGAWVLDATLTAMVPAGGYVKIYGAGLTTATFGPGLYNWASRRRLD